MDNRTSVKIFSAKGTIPPTHTSITEPYFLKFLISGAVLLLFLNPQIVELPTLTYIISVYRFALGNGRDA